MSQTEETDRGFTPPYNVSFRTFLNLFQRMEEEGGTPPRIDRSYLTNLAGQAQTYLISALRSFRLIEENGNHTKELDRLALEPAERPKLIGDLLRRFYPNAVNHGEMNGTAKQLEEAFSEYGLTGDTLRKAMSFYLQAAEYSGLSISRYVQVRKAAPRKAHTPTRRTGRRTPGGGRDAQPPPPTPEPQPDTTAALRAEYVKRLMDKALGAGEEAADPGLLDRIERLLGYDSGPADGLQEDGQITAREGGGSVTG